MAYQIEIKQRAALMIRDAFEWYEEQQRGLGETLLSCIEISINKIVTHPEYYSFCAAQYRQINVPKFPFVIVFELIDSKVVVFAVFHTSRDGKFKF